MNKHFALIIVTLNGIIIAGFLGVRGWLPPVPEKIEEIIEERKVAASKCRNCTDALDLSPGEEKLNTISHSNGSNVQFIISHIEKPTEKSVTLCFETPHLIFREIKESDVNDIFTYAHKSEVAARTKWTPHKSKIETLAIVEKWLELARKNYISPWAIQDKLSGRVIGTANFGYSPQEPRGEISYVLDSSFWHRGYEVEILRAMIEIGFVWLKCNRISSLARCDVPELSRFLEQAGMSNEGIEPDYKYLNNKYISYDAYSVIREEIDQKLLSKSLYNKI